jgi:hypothetical protein
VDDLLELHAGLGEAEDDARDDRAVHSAGLVEDLLAPEFDEAGPDIGAAERLAGLGVGIGDHRAEVAEDPGHSALAGADAAGDTARVLKNEGIDTIGMLDSKEDTTRALVDFLARIRAGTAPIASDSGIARHSRYNHAGEVAQLLDSVMST